MGIYLLKVNKRNTKTRCEICSKLTIKTPERRHWRRSGVFIINFEHISHLEQVDAHRLKVTYALQKRVKYLHLEHLKNTKYMFKVRISDT